MKRKIALLLAIVLVFSSLNVLTYAKANDDGNYENKTTISEEVHVESINLIEWITENKGNSSLVQNDILKPVTSAGAVDYDGARAALQEGVNNWKTEINIYEYNIPMSEVEDLYFGFVFDNPQLFYIKSEFGYSNIGDVIYSIFPKYNDEYTLSDVEIYESTVENIMGKIPDALTDEEIALAVHDYLVAHCEYDVSLSYYDAYSALVSGETVCQGYALAYKDLLNRFEIECEYVASSEMAHAWNLVDIEGKWYHVDTTWDDSLVAGSDMLGFVLHTNFLRSDAGITNTGHYNWVTNNICADDKYDLYYWSDIESAMFFTNDTELYYIYDGVLTKRDGETTNAISNTADDVWYVWGNESSYWPIKRNAIVLNNNVLYFNDATNVYAYDLSSEEETVYYTYEGAEGYIYGLSESINGKQLKIEIRKSPNEGRVCVEYANLNNNDDNNEEDEKDDTEIEEDYGELLVSGECGEKLDWLLYVDGTMVISGEGKMWDMQIETDPSGEVCPWDEYKEEIKKLIIKSGVTNVGRAAFLDCTKIKNVEFPDSLERVEHFAFDGCTSIEEINLPEELIYIGQQAFNDCDTITSFVIPDSVRYVMGSICGGCDSLTYVYWGGREPNPDSNEIYMYIYSSRPIGATGLTYIDVSPDHYTLKSIDGVLYSKDEKKIVEYPRGRKEKSYSVKEGTEIIFGSSICGTQLEEIVLPEGLKEIDPHGIDSNYNLKSIIIPESVEVIGSNSIFQCYNMEYIDNRSNVVIPYAPYHEECWADVEGNKVMELGKGITYIYRPIRSITLPKTISMNVGDIVEVPDDIGYRYINSMFKNKKDLIYTSLNTDIVTISDEGIITALSEGTVEIIVEARHALYQEPPKVTCTITVTDPNKCEHTEIDQEIKNLVEATCTADGSYDEVHICKGCQEELSRETKVIKSEGHLYDDGQVTKEPTHENDGEKTYTCSKCGHTKTETIEMLKYAYGDVNWDGKINVVDAILIKRKVAGFEDSNFHSDVTDVNLDGKINVVDAILIMRYIAGYDVTLGKG